MAKKQILRKMYLALFVEILVFLTFLPRLLVARPRSQEEFKKWSRCSSTGILIHYKTDIADSCVVLVFYASLNSRDYKIKLKTTLYTTVSIDIDAYYWDTQGVATFFS